MSTSTTSKEQHRARLRREIDHDEILNKIKRQTGQQWRATSSGRRTFLCPTCSAPVVDSEDGRKAHRARMPGCDK